MESVMATGFTTSPMEIDTMANTPMTFHMATGSIVSAMDRSMKVSGWSARSTASASIPWKLTELGNGNRLSLLPCSISSQLGRGMG